jgi:hypothetical protein
MSHYGGGSAGVLSGLGVTFSRAKAVAATANSDPGDFVGA